MMGQSMHNRFEKDSIQSHPIKFSSSVGFRDMPPRHQSKSKFGDYAQSPGLRSAGLRDYAYTAEDPNNYATIIKTMFLNCQEMNHTNYKKLKAVKDLLDQNEEHFVDLVENTDRFLQDIQEAGFTTENLETDERRQLLSSNQNKTRKYMREIDGVIDEYAQRSNQKRLLSPNQPYKTFNNSARAGRRGEGFRDEFLGTKEAALFDRINDLQVELQEKETTVADKYESIVSKLEKKLKLEAQLHNDSRRKYKVLVQLSSNFQSALKDLQKAVRTKKYNISSYKKIFEERSKQLSNELLKYKNKIRTTAGNTFTQRRDTYEPYVSGFRSSPITPERSADRSRPKSENRVAPTNLNKVYYNEGGNRDEELQNIIEKLGKVEKQLESSKLKLKEVNKERDILQEL